MLEENSASTFEAEVKMDVEAIHSSKMMVTT
jgi:hypothetical protein